MLQTVSKSQEIVPIGHIRSPYREKFAIPRQPNLASAAIGVIEFCPGFNDANMLRGIEEFSHLWLIFQFHHTRDQGWKPLVRPPRLGGNQKKGVLATRSTFRPNNLGLSVVKLEKVSTSPLTLSVSGIDLADGTPIIDIKPYLPYADIVEDAKGAYAPEKPVTLNVTLSPTVGEQMTELCHKYPNFDLLLNQVLSQDPRPAYQRHESNRVYGVTLYDLNVRFVVNHDVCTVTEISALSQS